MMNLIRFIHNTVSLGLYSLIIFKVMFGKHMNSFLKDRTMIFQV